MPVADSPQRSTEVARQLAAKLDDMGQDYAFGGALALGFWAEPRGTLDVDLTLFVSLQRPTECVWIIGQLGCDIRSAEAISLLTEHGFCQATWGGVRVDIFVPTYDFYDTAKARRRRVLLGHQPIWIWDAESLSVFKMMFFRTKDIADLESILLTQGHNFDRNWVRGHLEGLFGARDPRLAEWDRLVTRIVPS